MIFHLMAAGVPISWQIVAVYKDSYGIAHRAATAYQESEEKDRETSPYVTSETMPTPHMLVEIDDRSGEWKVKRTDLMMSERYLKRQQHDERSWILQDQTSPFPLEDAVKDLLVATIVSELKAFGYLISRADWERRYPAQKIVSESFAAFSRAYEAHKASGSTERMPFDIRWAQHMESPRGFVWPYDVVQDGETWLVTEHGKPFGDLSSGDRDEAAAMMRLLNSGYRLDDIPVLMADQPVDDA